MQRNKPKSTEFIEKREMFSIILKEYAPHADDRLIHQSKKGNWFLRTQNDYPLQHGEGEEIKIPDGFADVLLIHFKRSKKNRERLKEAVRAGESQ